MYIDGVIRLRITICTCRYTCCTQGKR